MHFVFILESFFIFLEIDIYIESFYDNHVKH